MGLARNGSRLITVNDIRYRWVVSPDDGFMVIVAEREDCDGQTHGGDRDLSRIGPQLPGSHHSARSSSSDRTRLARRLVPEFRRTSPVSASQRGRQGMGQLLDTDAIDKARWSSPVIPLLGGVVAFNLVLWWLGQSEAAGVLGIAAFVLTAVTLRKVSIDIAVPRVFREPTVVLGLAVFLVGFVPTVLLREPFFGAIFGPAIIAGLISLAIGLLFSIDRWRRAQIADAGGHSPERQPVWRQAAVVLNALVLSLTTLWALGWVVSISAATLAGG